MHVDASIQEIRAILEQLGEDKINHSIYFANHKMVDVENNYIVIEQEALDMVYTLQDFIIIC